MRSGYVEITITRSVREGDEDVDLDYVVGIEYELDAYGCRVGLHRDDRVYGPLTEDEEERAIERALEDALGD